AFLRPGDAHEFEPETGDGFRLHEFLELIADLVVTGHSDADQSVVVERLRGPLDVLGEVEQERGLDLGFREHRLLRRRETREPQQRGGDDEPGDFLKTAAKELNPSAAAAKEWARAGNGATTWPLGALANKIRIHQRVG